MLNRWKHYNRKDDRKPFLIPATAPQPEHVTQRHTRQEAPRVRRGACAGHGVRGARRAVALLESVAARVRRRLFSVEGLSGDERPELDWLRISKSGKNGSANISKTMPQETFKRKYLYVDKEAQFRYQARRCAFDVPK